MPDIYDKAKRSALMSKVRGSGNRATELRLIAIFRSHSIIGWRRNQLLLGRPDFVFRRERVAVFVDGCFWHGCPVHGKRPATNVEFWNKKLNANIIRDVKIGDALRKNGWHVLRIWQHELTRRNEGPLAIKLRRLLETSQNE